VKDAGERSPQLYAASLAREHTADIVEILNKLTLEEQAQALIDLPGDKAVEVLDEPGLDDPAGLVELLPAERTLQLLAGMSADRVAEVFRTMTDPPRADLMRRLDPETRANLNRLLSFPEDTAGRLMTTEFVSVPSTWTVAE